MKTLTVTSLLLLCIALTSYTQDYKKEKIVGTYEYNKQYSKKVIAGTTIILSIHKDKSFVYEYSDHIFRSSLKNGYWYISGDTLLLTIGVKENSKEIFDKYIISENQLCEISEQKNDRNICLGKQVE